MVEAKNLKLTN
jgi:hypothetical protein